MRPAPRLSRTVRSPGLAVLAAILLVVTALTTVTSTNATAATTFSSTVTNGGGGGCMTVPGGATTAGLQLVQLTCNGSTTQSFTFTPVTGTTSTYTIGTVTAGSCLDVSGVSVADNAQVIQWPCNGQTNQQFTVSPAGSGFNIAAVHSGKCVVPSADATVSNTPLVQLPCTTATTRTWQIAGLATGTSGFQGLPAVAPNACHNAALPKSYGTNFPTPNDPFSQGFFNDTALGWDGNFWPVTSYLSGSFFARGVPTTFNNAGTTICGAMYSFSIYQLGGVRPAQSVQWTQESGYLPAMTTSFTSGTTAVSIKDFADKVTIGGNPFMLIYSRVSVTNHGTAAVTIDPGGTGPNLLRLTSTTLNTVAPGATSNHDYVVAVDNFGTGAALPTGAALSAGAPTLAVADTQLASHWNGRLAETTNFTLPNITLPNTGNLANPGNAMINAFKAGEIYMLMMQVGEAQFSAANNYSWVLNHDVPGELTARFETGDYQDARNLLLTARISETPNFNEVGANWYFDGDWKTLGAWATYLAKTNDTSFVSQFFHDDATAASPWGPSLFTIMHTIYSGQLSPDGVLKASFDNDSSGRWLFDDYSALEALASYRFIATKIGQTSEATFANTAYNSLLNSLNTLLARNESANGFNFLPCTVDQPDSANRCDTFNDANWASPLWVGQNQWSTMLMGGVLSGIAGDPNQGDGRYTFGFNRLAANGLPFPTFGAFNGFSTAYNTAYSSDGLYGTARRDLSITSYAWQIQTTTGGPNTWWEANGSGPSTANIWAGSHAPPQFGAVPYAWPIAHQQLALIRAIAAEGLTASGSGPFTYTRPL
ncbi:MAG TPA: RICIN domain-containing protein, partial [Pseudonocardiaceae bacterium]|nr:RICIN domain-containing protein [Pseudonocardiaceae bacterium]